MAGDLPPWEDDSTWSTLSGKQSTAVARQLERGADNPLAQAYQAGADGLPALEGWSPQERAAWQDGRSDAAAAKPKPDLSLAADRRGAHQAPRTPSGGSAGSRLVAVRHQVSGFLLGAVVAALVLSYLEYGSAGPKSWVAAKFWNAPSLPGQATGGATPSMAEQFNPAKPVPV